MKALVQLLAVVGISLAGAAATWLVLGVPVPTVPCEAAQLEPGEVCLADLSGTAGEILWIDARPRAEWQRDGLEGSILVTDHPGENLDELVAEAFPHLVGASRAVVYCSDSGCATSKTIAAVLRELNAGPEILVLHGGWRALEAAGRVARPGK